LSKATAEKIDPMKESFQKGKCDEPKAECKEPLSAYCKRGYACAGRKGRQTGPGTLLADQIFIK
jgi:hypothetical protein